jgi:hypothetical protein
MRINYTLPSNRQFNLCLVTLSSYLYLRIFRMEHLPRAFVVISPKFNVEQDRACAELQQKCNCCIWRLRKEFVNILTKTTDSQYVVSVYSKNSFVSFTETKPEQTSSFKSVKDLLSLSGVGSFLSAYVTRTQTNSCDYSSDEKDCKVPPFNRFVRKHYEPAVFRHCLIVLHRISITCKDSRCEDETCECKMWCEHSRKMNTHEQEYAINNLSCVVDLWLHY